MSQDPADSRRSLAFDRARRALVLGGKPVGGDPRKEWLDRFTELLKAMFPEGELKVAKPGLATRMYSADVAIGSRDKIVALDLARELDDNWRVFAQEYGTIESCCYLDRLDGMWEWIVDLGDGTFVTGHARLKNSAFVTREDRPERSDSGFQRGRPGGFGNRGRPDSRRPYGDRDRRPGGDRPYRDRPYGDRERSGGDRPYGDRRPGGDRPYRDRPYGDRDRPGGDRPFRDRPYGNRERSYGDRPYRERGRDFDDRGRGGFKGPRKPFEDRPYRKREDDAPPRSEDE
ncbi:MAG: hypothetical protein IT207_08480 [Fimbriimonadaceae bacterium]|nr:hypothetical protein [Fimbriimonadaceae bacterium]